MKKNLFLSIVFIIATTSVFAQKSLNRFFSKYAHLPNADYVNIGRLPMMFIHPFIDDDDASFLKKIHKVEVLDIDLNEHEKNNIHDDMRNLKNDLLQDGFDEMMFVKSEGDKINILGKTDNDDVVKDCILLVDNADEISVIHLSGKIKLSEIGNLSEKFRKGKFNLAKN